MRLVVPESTSRGVVGGQRGHFSTGWVVFGTAGGRRIPILRILCSFLLRDEPVRQRATYVSAPSWPKLYICIGTACPNINANRIFAPTVGGPGSGEGEPCYVVPGNSP